MKRTLRFLQVYLAVSLCFGTATSYGQTALTAGDIAFVGFNIDGDDDYAFLLLKNITAGTQLYITDKGWLDATASFTDYPGDETITWTATTNMNAGSVIQIKTSNDGTTRDPDLATVGSVTGGTVLGTFGDQLFIFQGSEQSPTFITGIHSNYTPVTNASNWDNGQVDASINANSDLPDQLVNGVNAIWVHDGTSEMDNNKYTGSTVSGSPEELRTAINNVANWSSDNTIAYDLSTLIGSFTVTSACTEPSIPTISTTPTSVCPGEEATLTITGNLNDATAWHIYTGSCGGTSLGTTAASGFTVTPSTQTTYYVRGEGGCTTPGSCGTATISINTKAIITGQPATTSSACEGDDPIVLSVAGTGIASYQWYNSDGAITDSTRSSLAIETKVGNSGKYHCVVTSECESVTSNDAVVTINPRLLTNKTVWCCYGSSFTFPDGYTIESITSPTQHLSDFTSQVTGCDSAVYTIVKINPTYDLTETKTICSGGSYTFPDGTTQENITEKVVYVSELSAVTGCDSIITTTVTPTNGYNLSEASVICPGGSYTFPDGTTVENITETISYVSYLQTETLGCDSVITTTVTISPTYNLVETVAVCSGSSYTFPDGIIQEKITEEVSYTSHLTTVAGNCDSTITTTLTVKPTYDISETVQICTGFTYTFPDGTKSAISENTTHISTLLTVNSSCDSIIRTVVLALPSYHTEETVSVCSGESYTFPDGTVTENITEPLEYTSAFETKSDACDSTITTTVLINETYNRTETVVVCSGSSYTFPDGTVQENITEEVIYMSSLTTENTNCDSIITTTVTVSPTYSKAETVWICSGSSHTFPDGTVQDNITEEINYTSNLLTASYSCDSAIVTTVSIYPNYSVTASKTVEYEESFQFGSQLLSQTGEYTEHFASEDGCDSTVVLTFTVKPKTVTTTIYDTICDEPNSEYQSPRTTEVSETIHKTNLDSVIVTVTQIYPSYEFESEKTIFIGTSIDFHGQSYSEAGTYSKVYETVNGCDSIYKLTLSTERKRVVTNLYDTICGQLSAEQMPMLVTNTIDSIRTVSEVDSITITNTVTYPIYEVAIDKTITFGDTLSFGTQKLFTRGTYNELFTTVNGCDSAVTLSLSVINKIERQTEIDTTCRLSESENPIITVSEKTDTLKATGEGIDIIITSITITYPSYDIKLADTITYGEIYTLGTRYLTTSGEYTEPFTTVQGCDSVVTLALTVLPKVVEHTEYDTICSPELINSPTRVTTTSNFIHVSDYIDSVAHLIVTEHSTFTTDIEATVDYGTAYEFDGKMLKTPGSYYQYLTSVAGCDSSVTLALKVSPTDVMTVQYDTTCGNIHTGPASIEYATQYDTLATSIGTDSIIKTIITLYPVYSIATKKTIRYGDTLVFAGQKLTESGIYSNKLKTVSGCDSSVVLTLTVLPDEIPNVGDSLVVTIKENPAKGTVIITLPIVDSNGDTLAYSLSDTVNFAIVDNKVVVVVSKIFDTETNPQVKLSITIDNGKETGVSVITINNSNVAEIPTLDFSKLVIEENSPKGTFIGELPAVDHEGDSVSYILSLTSLITLEGRKIYIADSAAFDAEKRAVSFYVTANDGTFRTFIKVDITVLNTNDNGPTISNNSLWFMLTEHSPTGTILGSVTGKDIDNDMLTYTITNNGNGAISIDPSTGIITVIDPLALDYETLGKIQTTISVSDGVFKIEKDLTVILLDGADPKPLTTPETQISVVVYPTISEGIVTIEIPETVATVAVFSENGTLFTKETISGTETMDISILPSGIYYIQIAIAGETVTQTIVKK